MREIEKYLGFGFEAKQQHPKPVPEGPTPPPGSPESPGDSGKPSDKSHGEREKPKKT